MKKPNHPLISIIIPVYNAEKYLAEAIESILSQKYKNFEIILIDDGSKDKSFDIIIKYVQNHKNIISVSQDNSGPSAARNNGIQSAGGGYITFLDSDDYWAASCLHTQIQHLGRNPDCEIIWGKTQFFKENDIPPMDKPEKTSVTDLGCGSIGCGSSYDMEDEDEDEDEDEYTDPSISSKPYRSSNYLGCGSTNVGC